MDTKGLPDSIIREIREKFDADPRVVELRRKQDLLRKNRDFVYAFKLGKEIDDLFQRTVDIYVESMKNEQVSFADETKDIPSEDKDALIDKLMVMFMCCDVICSAVMDFNSILKRSKPDLEVTSFSDMVKLSEMAKTKLRYLEENSQYMNDVIWPDRCDDMYEMMCNKAKSIIRKRKMDKRWGDNFEKLEVKK